MGIFDFIKSAGKAVDAEPVPASDPAGCQKFWKDGAQSQGTLSGLLSEMRQAEIKFRQENGHAR